MKFSPIHLPKSPEEGLSGQHQKIMNNHTLPSETSHSNQEEADKLPFKLEPNDLQHHPFGSHAEEENDRILSCKNEHHSDILIQQSTPNPDYSATSGKTVQKLQPRRNTETGCFPSQSDQAIVPFVAPLTQSNRKFSYLTKFEKLEKLQPRRNPEHVVVQDSQSDAENTPSIPVFEKRLDDGYNWRKYGQKLVKGNKFTRSYYKCTYPNCQAKKQVEKSHDGSQMEINFLGNHLHPKPQNSPQVNSLFQQRLSDAPTLAASNCDAEPIMEATGTLLVDSTVAKSIADGVTESVSCSNNDDKDAKRMKREVTCADENVVSSPNKYSRHVVQTLSEVGIVNDGYRWRKYGQKFVKGNPNPRSYYRCSSAGCPVKKHVERASHDPKLVITTYEGQHDHEMPLRRTASQCSTTTNAINNKIMIGEPRQKPDDPHVALDMAVHVSSK